MDSRVSIDKIEYDISDGSITSAKLPNLLSLFTEINQTRKNNKPLKFYLFGLIQYILIDDEDNNFFIGPAEIINISSLINSDLVEFTNAYVTLRPGNIREVRTNLSFKIGDTDLTIPLFIYNGEMPLKQKALKIRYAFEFYFA